MTAPFRHLNAPQPAARAPQRDHGPVEVIMPEQYADRRAEPRQTRDDKGALLFLSSREIITCRILDSSASGARVALNHMDIVPAEIWLIDLATVSVKRGSAAWTAGTRMGLKFNFIQKMTDDSQRPAKVPQEVYDAWLRLKNGPEAPVKKTPEAPEDNAVYFD